MLSDVEMRLRGDRGFSLLELMVSLAILMIISSGAFLLLNQNQKVYVSHSNNGAMYSEVRSAAELITQEIGQAGSLCGSVTSCFQTTLNGSVAAGGTPVLTTTAGLFPGEKLTIDPNSNNREVVQIATVVGSTITLNGSTPLSSGHPSGAVVTVQGVFPNGIMTPISAGNGSTGTKLKLFGDINGDGTLVYVEYVCDFTLGTLTRFVAPIGSTAIAANQPGVTLIDNLIFVDPTGSAAAQYCFSYSPTPPVPVVANDGLTYTLTTQVGLLISVQSPNIDPQTKQRAKMTKSFLSLSPRNIIAANDMLINNVTDALQPAPQVLPVN